MRSRSRAKLTLLALALAAAAGCSAFKIYEFKSLWTDREILIDGRAEDWRGAQSFIEEQQILIGIRNDPGFLYIGLVAESRFTNMQIMSRGLTVWFDPKGGEEKSWGIQYPLGLAQTRPSQGEWADFLPPDALDDTEPEWPEEALKELQIIRPQLANPVKMDLARARGLGLEVCVQAEAGLFTYELKVPLRAVEKNWLAVGASPGRTIGLGFEAGELRMRGPGGGMPGGGMGRPPRGSSMGRGGGRMEGPGMGFGRPEPLKIWAIVRLASENRPANAAVLQHSSRRD